MASKRFTEKIEMKNWSGAGRGHDVRGRGGSFVGGRSTRQSPNDNTPSCSPSPIVPKNIFVSTTASSTGAITKDKKKERCATCKKVGGSAKWIECSTCGEWYHIYCESMTDDEFEHYKQNNVDYACLTCYEEPPKEEDMGRIEGMLQRMENNNYARFEEIKSGQDKMSLEVQNLAHELRDNKRETENLKELTNELSDKLNVLEGKMMDAHNELVEDLKKKLEDVKEELKKEVKKNEYKTKADINETISRRKRLMVEGFKEEDDPKQILTEVARVIGMDESFDITRMTHVRRMKKNDGTPTASVLFKCNEEKSQFQKLGVSDKIKSLDEGHRLRNIIMYQDRSKAERDQFKEQKEECEKKNAQLTPEERGKVKWKVVGGRIKKWKIPVEEQNQDP